MKYLDIKQNKSLKDLILWIRNYINKVWFFLLFVISIYCLYADYNNQTFIRKFSAIVNDNVIDIIRVINIPRLYFSNILSVLYNHKTILKQDKEFKDHQALLTKYLSSIHELKSENARLKSLLNFIDINNHLSYVSTRIVGVNNGNFINSAFIPIGSKNGVDNNQAVINIDGLVGKVINVGTRSAQILFLTDARFRVPVITAESGIRAILSGDSNGNLKLLHLSDKHLSLLKIGESVITAGDDQYFPYGIYVGYIASDKKTVQKYVDLQKTDLVMVIKSKR